MNEDTLKGGSKSGAGELEGAAGDVLGDRELQAKGSARQVEGHAQEAVGSAKQALGQVADQVRQAVSQTAGQAREAYGRVTDQARSAADVVDPFVRQQPYAALGVAAAAGLVVGLLLAGRGPKIVYVKPRA